MKKQIFAVCDPEMVYVRRFCDYINKKETFPFEAAAYTSRETLEAFCQEEEVKVLLISEHIFELSLKEKIRGDVLILSDNETEEDEKIYKYQSCESVLRKVMNVCTAEGSKEIPKPRRYGNLHMIGLYTPVHRCLQTGFAMTLGEILAKNHKTLYLNFESFSGFSRRIDREFMTDMSDLIYYVSNAREALFYKLKGMTGTFQNLDYIPPVFSCMDLARITLDQWLSMFQELEKHTEYEYVILDLSEHIQGLFDILRMCEKIFTLVREDDGAIAKLYHYEKLLERADYEDIMKKTRKYRLPFIRNLSFDVQELTYGELAEHARKLLKEELYES